MTIARMIAQEVSSWPGVSVAPHRFGGTEFRVAHHEIGHLHGGRLADLPFPRRRVGGVPLARTACYVAPPCAPCN
jgi:hypothetical protein